MRKVFSEELTSEPHLDDKLEHVMDMWELNPSQKCKGARVSQPGMAEEQRG